MITGKAHIWRIERTIKSYQYVCDDCGAIENRLTLAARRALTCDSNFHGCTDEAGHCSCYHSGNDDGDRVCCDCKAKGEG